MKIRTKHLNMILGVILATLCVSIIASCAGQLPMRMAAPSTANVTTLDSDLLQPATAVVLDQPNTIPVVVPDRMPTISNENITPQPTTVPLPTATPLPPFATTMPVSSNGQAFPPRTGQIQFGAAAHLFYTDRYTPLTRAQDAGLGWVRQQIHWKDQEGPGKFYAWGELDDIVADVNGRGLKLLISIVRSPSFYTANGGDGMPDDPQALGDFVAALATHYRGRVHAIQIWNEQNLAHENGGQVDVSDAGKYVELLKVAYTRIKEVDPSIIVVSGAPASTATNGPGVAVSDMRYYRAMFEYQNGIMRNYVDAVGVHPGGSANAPETLWPGEPSTAQGWTNDPTFYFRNIENVRALMETYGMEKHPVWITEFGWATANSTPGFEFGQQVSFDLQADYIRRAMLLTAERYPWVDAMFVWNLNFAPLRAQSGDPNHEQASFGILDANYNPRPAFYAIQQTIGEVREMGR
ncbi:MAG: cellulase family glycosylhydrolase [Roseiflexaceae bacterium]